MASDKTVLLALAQTLTNKTIDADNNTISNLAHGSEVDNPSSGVHGVTGSVVGTTDTQTLTNKTLTTPTITTPTITSPKINEDVALTATSTELNQLDDTTITAFAKTVLDDTTASDFLSTIGVTAFAKTILDDTDAATVLLTIGAQQHIVGMPFLWFTETPPTGANEFDGSALSRTTYSTLFALWGTTFGVGDGSTTFGTPDVRGLFPRFWDNGAGIDPDAATRTDRGDGTGGDHVATIQADQNKSHTHTVNVENQTGAGFGQVDGQIGDTAANKTTSSNGGDEARPKNIYMMLCYWHS